jgi:hypothetical protein
MKELHNSCYKNSCVDGVNNEYASIINTLNQILEWSNQGR